MVEDFLIGFVAGLIVFWMFSCCVMYRTRVGEDIVIDERPTDTVVRMPKLGAKVTISRITGGIVSERRRGWSYSRQSS